MPLIKDTENHFCQAIDCYRRTLGSIFKYHDYLFDLRHGIDLVRYKNTLKKGRSSYFS